MTRYLIGIDEAGRGPLAGPVAVGAVALPHGFKTRRIFPDLKDSKQLSAVRREEIYSQIRLLAKDGRLQFCVRFSSSSVIDRRGISHAVKNAVHRSIRTLAPQPHGARVLLDGLLHAPEGYEQETIIKGDEKEPAIMLASIVAKVRRDRLMRNLARKFPQYGFEIHKGYGTKLHAQAVKELGLCEIHRTSFCKNIVFMGR